MSTRRSTRQLSRTRKSIDQIITAVKSLSPAPKNRRTTAALKDTLPSTRSARTSVKPTTSARSERTATPSKERAPKSTTKTTSKLQKSTSPSRSNARKASIESIRSPVVTRSTRSKVQTARSPSKEATKSPKSPQLDRSKSPKPTSKTSPRSSSPTIAKPSNHEDGDNISDEKQPKPRSKKIKIGLENLNNTHLDPTNTQHHDQSLPEIAIPHIPTSNHHRSRRHAGGRYLFSPGCMNACHFFTKATITSVSIIFAIVLFQIAIVLNYYEINHTTQFSLNFLFKSLDTSGLADGTESSVPGLSENSSFYTPSTILVTLLLLNLALAALYFPAHLFLDAPTSPLSFFNLRPIRMRSGRDHTTNKEGDKSVNPKSEEAEATKKPKRQSKKKQQQQLQDELENKKPRDEIDRANRLQSDSQQPQRQPTDSEQLAPVSRSVSPNKKPSKQYSSPLSKPVTKLPSVNEDLDELYKLFPEFKHPDLSDSDQGCEHDSETITNTASMTPIQTDSEYISSNDQDEDDEDDDDDDRDETDQEHSHSDLNIAQGSKDPTQTDSDLHLQFQSTPSKPGQHDKDDNSQSCQDQLETPQHIQKFISNTKYMSHSQARTIRKTQQYDNPSNSSPQEQQHQYPSSSSRNNPNSPHLGQTPIHIIRSDPHSHFHILPPASQVYTIPGKSNNGKISTPSKKMETSVESTSAQMSPKFLTHPQSVLKFNHIFDQAPINITDYSDVGVNKVPKLTLSSGNESDDDESGFYNQLDEDEIHALKSSAGPQRPYSHTDTYLYQQQQSQQPRQRTASRTRKNGSTFSHTTPKHGLEYNINAIAARYAATSPRIGSGSQMGRLDDELLDHSGSNLTPNGDHSDSSETNGSPYYAGPGQTIPKPLRHRSHHNSHGMNWHGNDSGSGNNHISNINNGAKPRTKNKKPKNDFLLNVFETFIAILALPGRLLLTLIELISGATNNKGSTSNPSTYEPSSLPPSPLQELIDDYCPTSNKTGCFKAFLWCMGSTITFLTMSISIGALLHYTSLKSFLHDLEVLRPVYLCVHILFSKGMVLPFHPQSITTSPLMMANTTILLVFLINIALFIIIIECIAAIIARAVTASVLTKNQSKPNNPSQRLSDLQDTNTNNDNIQTKNKSSHIFTNNPRFINYIPYFRLVSYTILTLILCSVFLVLPIFSQSGKNFIALAEEWQDPSVLTQTGQTSAKLSQDLARIGVISHLALTIVLNIHSIVVTSGWGLYLVIFATLINILFILPVYRYISSTIRQTKLFLSLFPPKTDTPGGNVDHDHNNDLTPSQQHKKSTKPPLIPQNCLQLALFGKNMSSAATLLGTFISLSILLALLSILIHIPTPSLIAYNSALSSTMPNRGHYNPLIPSTNGSILPQLEQNTHALPQLITQREASLLNTTILESSKFRSSFGFFVIVLTIALVYYILSTAHKITQNQSKATFAVFVETKVNAMDPEQNSKTNDGEHNTTQTSIPLTIPFFLITLCQWFITLLIATFFNPIIIGLALPIFLTLPHLITISPLHNIPIIAMFMYPTGPNGVQFAPNSNIAAKIVGVIDESVGSFGQKVVESGSAVSFDFVEKINNSSQTWSIGNFDLGEPSPMITTLVNKIVAMCNWLLPHQFWSSPLGNTSFFYAISFLSCCALFFYLLEIYITQSDAYAKYQQRTLRYVQEQRHAGIKTPPIVGSNQNCSSFSSRLISVSIL